MSSKTNTVITDSSIKTGAEVGLLQAAGATYSETNQNLMNSMLMGDNQGEVIFNQFPEAVQSSLKDLIGSVDNAINTAAQTSIASTQALGQKLQDVAVGKDSIIPKVALYAVIGIAIIVIGTKVIK